MAEPQGVRFRMRVHVAERDPVRFPREDEALGESLFGLLADALTNGRIPPPAMLVIRDRQVDQFDLLPILKEGGWSADKVLGALVGRDHVEGAALVGVLVVRQGMKKENRPVQAAVCFVEWPDNRWWTAWQPLDPQNRLVGGEPVVRRAIDGYPKPAGVGGWFASARRNRLRIDLKPVEGTLVH